MTTNDLLKKIYNELKERFIKNPNEIFLKEYEIPSINYNADDNTLEDHYFASGIEMELYKILDSFDNKVYCTNYKDTYFFSNDKELANNKMLESISTEDREI